MSGHPLSPQRRSYYDYDHPHPSLPHRAQHQHPHPHPPPQQHQQQHHHHHHNPSHHHAAHSELHQPHERAALIPPTSATAYGAASYAPQPSSSALPPSVQRPMHQLVPEQQLQLANIHRFTPSCSRCRQKKLKCDTNLPCNQCIAKGVHDDCRKDSRVPRGRKRPKLATTSSDKPEDEIVSLRKRVKELEDKLARQSEPGTPSQPPSPSASHHFSDKRSVSSRKLGTSSRGSQTTGPSEVGISNSRDHYSPTAASFDSDDEEPGETEHSLVTLEKLAASDPRVSEPGHGKSMHKQINNVLPTQIPHDGPNAYFAAPDALNERIEILMLAKRIVPEKSIVDTLLHTFNIRCHSLVGRIVHMPSFTKDIHFFLDASIEELLTSPLGMYDLSRFMMILRLGMRFYPWKGGMFIDDTTPEFITINALRNRGDDISMQWLNLAKRALAADRTFSLASLKAIQTALLMILDGRDSPTYLRMLLRISIQTALDMGLHRLGNAMPSPSNPEEDIVRLETGVRIWWYLVVKDWCSAQREGAYTVHPTQMTTRKPLHTTDARLSEGRTDQISLDDHCETSYTLCQIQLANIIRESIDLRNEQSTLGGTYDVISPNNKKLLHVKLETFLSDLPPFYRLGSTEMQPGVLAVQRCLLHQQTFDVLLKLNRKSLSSYSERATCALLAEQIVSTQKLLRSVCPVIDGFWVNFLHLFGATLTLTISLLLDDDMDAETRERRRSKVHTALTTMRETPGSDRGSRIIEILLKEEQKQWDTGLQDGDVAARRRPLDLATLTRRIVAQSTELADATGRSDSAGLIPVPIESHTAPARGAANLTWDTTPDESIIPAFASSWGAVATDPTDPTGIIASFGEAPNYTSNGLFPSEPHIAHRSRPYEHSLRPWQEPSHLQQSSSSSGVENNLWDWVFSQAALLHGPEPPVEGPQKTRPESSVTRTSSSHSRTMPSPLSPQAEQVPRRPQSSGSYNDSATSSSHLQPHPHAHHRPYPQSPQSHHRSPSVLSATHEQSMLPPPPQLDRADPVSRIEPSHLYTSRPGGPGRHYPDYRPEY
ncbi:uncharacterized protein UTRI_01864_B [Ustilago trichophora]|uniref:Zn(2)-C6 fungal-type domain-containing protein n=1 Tax=Ustilago trichophora TaxID=86804 RepID=A0A5C3DUB0_9BASI|nr:uncharacterized protein UTRI_01864_B [Ustilago trichophora]